MMSSVPPNYKLNTDIDAVMGLYAALRDRKENTNSASRVESSSYKKGLDASAAFLHLSSSGPVPVNQGKPKEAFEKERQRRQTMQQKGTVYSWGGNSIHLTTSSNVQLSQMAASREDVVRKDPSLNASIKKWREDNLQKSKSELRAMSEDLEKRKKTELEEEQNRTKFKKGLNDFRHKLRDVLKKERNPMQGQVMRYVDNGFVHTFMEQYESSSENTPVDAALLMLNGGGSQSMRMNTNSQSSRQLEFAKMIVLPTDHYTIDHTGNAVIVSGPDSPINVAPSWSSERSGKSVKVRTQAAKSSKMKRNTHPFEYSGAVLNTGDLRDVRGGGGTDNDESSSNVSVAATTHSRRFEAGFYKVEHQGLPPPSATGVINDTNGARGVGPGSDPVGVDPLAGTVRRKASLIVLTEQLQEVAAWGEGLSAKVQTSFDENDDEEEDDTDSEDEEVAEVGDEGGVMGDDAGTGEGMVHVLMSGVGGEDRAVPSAAVAVVNNLPAHPSHLLHLPQDIVKKTDGTEINPHLVLDLDPNVDLSNDLNIDDESVPSIPLTAAAGSPMNAIRSSRFSSRTLLSMKSMNLGTTMSPTASIQLPTTPYQGPVHPLQTARGSSAGDYRGVSSGPLRLWAQPQRKHNGRYVHGRGAPPIGTGTDQQGLASPTTLAVLQGLGSGVSLTLQKSLTVAASSTVLPATHRPFFS